MVTLTFLYQTITVIQKMTICASKWFLTMLDMLKVSYIIACESILYQGLLVSNDMNVP